MAHSVICFGEVLWDCFKEGKMAGGAPMNVALHLFKQGVNSILLSAVGADDNGKELLHFLEEKGLSTAFVQKSSLPTGVVDVHLDESNQATYTIVKPVAWDEIIYQPDWNAIAGKADAIVFGSLACRSERSRKSLMQLLKKVPLTIFDMNLRPPHFENKVLEDLMLHADILKINEHELDFLTELYQKSTLSHHELFSFLAEKFGIKTIVITLGESGARVWQKNNVYTHPGYKVQVADTVGAGDAFLATFISGLLHKYPMQQVLTRSCAVGALVASRSGANPDYNTSDIFQICNT